MNRFFLALVISTALTAPAFADAMAADLACSAFMAMGHDDQMGAMTAAMASDKMAADGAMAADTMAADGAMATDKTAADGAMATDTMAADGAMATDTTSKTGDAMADAPAMSADDEMAAMVKACTAHPDMMATDAMHMMQ